MNSKALYIFLLIAATLVHIFAVYTEREVLTQMSQLFFLVPLIGYFSRRIPVQNFNFYTFLVFVALAELVTLMGRNWYFEHLSLGLWMIAIIFLVREALQFTEYTKGSRFMLLYFVLIVATYIYLFSLHILEIEENLADGILFSLYVIYYGNLLVLGIIALIYYLNSFSRKSVFFICLALSFILSDVLRDMKVFYFKDVSVEIAAGLLKFAALIFVFQFFSTKERKLRLLNLV